MKNNSYISDLNAIKVIAGVGASWLILTIFVFPEGIEGAFIVIGGMGVFCNFLFTREENPDSMYIQYKAFIAYIGMIGSLFIAYGDMILTLQFWQLASWIYPAFFFIFIKYFVFNKNLVALFHK